MKSPSDCTMSPTTTQTGDRVLLRTHLDRQPKHLPLIAGAAVLSLCASSAGAGWQSVSVDFDRAYALTAAQAATQPDMILVGCTGGALYRTLDGGNNWIDLSDRLPPDTSFGQIAISPSDPNLVLIGSGGEWPDGPPDFLRSTNGGDSWTSSNSGLGGQQIGAIVFDPGDASIVYAGSYFSDDGGVYKSEDGGLSWSWTTEMFGHVGVVSIALNPSDTDQILATSPDGVYRSTNGGNSWTFDATHPSLRSLSWNADDPSVVYAIDNIDLLRSTDSGSSFSVVAIPTQSYAPRVVASDPTDANRVFLGVWDGCTNGLFDTGALYRSVDSGQTWENVFTSPDCADTPKAVLFHPSDPTRMFLASTGPVGLFVSSNSGSTWSVQNSGVAMYGVDAVDEDAAGTLFGRGSTTSVRATSPATWSGTETPFYAFVGNLDAHPVLPNRLYECGESVIEGDITFPYAVSSTNGGTDWFPGPGQLPAGLPTNAYPQHITAAWNADRVFTFHSVGVYRSDNAHASYSQVSTLNFTKGSVDPTNPNRVAAARRTDPPLQISEDGGFTWTPRTLGLPIETPVAIEFNPKDADHISIVFRETGAYETTDAGMTWNPAFGTPGDIRAADWNPDTGYYYFIVPLVGVVSNDPQVTNEGLPTLKPESICYADAHNTVILGTDWHGIYILPLLDPASAGDTPRVGSTIAPLLASPNPSSGEVRITLRSPLGIGETAIPDLGIYDARGRQVRRLQLSTRPMNQGEVVWNGRDESGRELPTGIYWVRLETGQPRSNGSRVLILR